jgi:hypothetical protein
MYLNQIIKKTKSKLLDGMKIPNDLREGEIWHITNEANYLVLDGMVCEDEGELIVCSFVVKNGRLNEFQPRTISVRE